MEEDNNLFELSVIIPCFNEQNNVDELVLRTICVFKDHAIKGEVILVNDGSTDNTKFEIEKLAKRFKNVIAISHVTNRGIVEAWSSGLRISKGRHVLTIDGDLQYRPEDIIELYRGQQKGWDLVQGWRQKRQDNDFLRRLLSTGLNLFLNAIFLLNLHDIKSSFVIYKREAFDDILSNKNRYRLFQHFFILAALKKGYRLKQIPITFYPRTKGKSFIRHPIIFSYKVITDIPRAILEFWGFNHRRNRGRYKCAV